VAAAGVPLGRERRDASDCDQHAAERHQYKAVHGHPGREHHGLDRGGDGRVGMNSEQADYGSFLSSGDVAVV
jgi:hypothetical protein